MYSYTYMNTYTWTHPYTMYTYSFTCSCIYTSIYNHNNTIQTWIQMLIHTKIIFVYLDTYTCIPIDIQTYTLIYSYIYAYFPPHIHMKTHTHKHMHEYMCPHKTTIIHTLIFSNTYAYELKHPIVRALMCTQRPLYLYTYVQEHAENFCLVFLLPKNQELSWIAA